MLSPMNPVTLQGGLLPYLHNNRDIRLNDVQHDLGMISAIRDSVRDSVPSFDDNRLLVIASVGKKGDSKMRVTLKKILEQSDAFGKRCDVLMGINCGMHLPNTERDMKASAVDCTNLYTANSCADDKGNHRAFEDFSMMHEEPFAISDVRDDMHRVFFVRQHDHPDARGKNKMLKVLNDLAIQSVDSGSWKHPPAHILEIDDDARFYDGLSMETNGLQILYGEMERKNLQAIGARWRNVRYTEDITEDGPFSNPDFTLPFDESYKFLDNAQSEYLRFMPGGGTLGDTDLLLAARWPIGHRYPCSKSDDFHRTMYVANTSDSWAIADYAYVLNECRDSEEQICRWLKGTFGLRQVLDRKFFTKLYKTFTPPPEMHAIPPMLDRIMSDACLHADRSLKDGRSDW